MPAARAAEWLVNWIWIVPAGAFAFVLLLFLTTWRAGVISLTAIPLSLLVAIIVLQRLGGTINSMTLGGLAIAIGEVVDDAFGERMSRNALRLLPIPQPDREVGRLADRAGTSTPGSAATTVSMKISSRVKRFSTR